ncbi:Hypothetical_protein [Hexamita inflata]|uniref:Hypothetical_protein n=1 Tax=Hexamita inflata TaxID=28002 RepID=A0AA86UMT6_9EUKA|nr:Hypothetical protein HINF_LOCUS32598 [Hexamita inflata]
MLTDFDVNEVPFIQQAKLPKRKVQVAYVLIEDITLLAPIIPSQQRISNNYIQLTLILENRYDDIFPTLNNVGAKCNLFIQITLLLILSDPRHNYQVLQYQPMTQQCFIFIDPLTVPINVIFPAEVDKNIKFTSKFLTLVLLDRCWMIFSCAALLTEIVLPRRDMIDTWFKTLVGQFVRMDPEFTVWVPICTLRLQKYD